MLNARRSKLTFLFAFLLASLLCQASLPVSLAAKAKPQKRVNLVRLVHRLPTDQAAAALSAATKQTTFVLEANLGTIEGYSAHLTFFKSGGFTSGGINLEKNVNFNQKFNQFEGQVHSYGFQMPKSGLSVGRVPKTAQIDSGNSIGDSGKMKGKFTGNDPVKKNTGGCGVLKLSKGNINGTFEFETNDQPFGKISVTKARASLTKHVFDSESEGCQAGSDIGCVFDGLELGGSTSTEGAQGTIVAYKKGDDAFMTASTFDQHTDGVFVFRTIGAAMAGSAFTATDNMKSASVQAPGGPLTGSGSYSSSEDITKQDVECGNKDEKIERTFGELTGDLTAHFDAAGDMSFASSGVLSRKP